MEDHKEEIVDNKLLRRIDQSIGDLITESIYDLSQDEIKEIARQFGDAHVWDALTKQVAGAMISIMSNELTEVNEVWNPFLTSAEYDDFEDAYFHLYTRGKEEFGHYKGWGLKSND